MEKIVVIVRECEGRVEYYMRDSAPFYVHIPPYDRDAGHLGDLRREVAERAIYCTLAHLDYDPEFKIE